MIDLTKKYKRDGVPVEVGVIGGVLISVDGNGQVHKHRESGLCLYNSGNDLIPYNEWEDFKEGEPVMVWLQNEEDAMPRYFARVKEGKPTTYYGGATKWSTGKDADVVTWNFCRRPTKEELGE